MKFKIIAELLHSDAEDKVFYYDNESNVISDETGFVWEYPEQSRKLGDLVESVPFSKDDPLKKSKLITTMKIQLGLSCNYSCDYCSQRYVERPPETSKKDIDAFMAQLETLEFSEEKGLRVEFWGGEPFVYWKTLKPLAEAIQEKFQHWEKQLDFGIVTNGSLLTREMCSWLYYMGFGVGISHDGPGQHVRGPDPFDDPAQKEIILEFYKVMKPLGRISFNAMMNNKNTSRKAVYDWFVNLTGDPTVSIGEGGFIDAYDDAAASNCLQSYEEHFAYRRQAFSDIYNTQTDKSSINFYLTFTKLDGFINGVLNHREAKYVNQKCGMDNQNTIAVDLKGNIVTCQNVSIVETSKNGESHYGGNLDDYDNVALKSVTHWKVRDQEIKCSECPVLHLCQGSCMYLDGDKWDITCANVYSDNIALFALAFEKITRGYVPKQIISDTLPLDRQDIWGTIYEHKDQPKKRIVPIKVVTEKVGSIDDVEVYGKIKIEG
jgi:uncharacterized protein